MKKEIRRKGLALAAVCCLLSAGMAFPSQAAKKLNRWEKLLEMYRQDDSTDRLIFVKYQGDSKARVELYKKIQKSGEYKWKKLLSCGAYVGKKGINKKEEGDKKTPTGTFSILSAFGIKKNPGTELPYTKVNKYHYWSEEKETYNQLVDVRMLGREEMAGEHLIDFKPAYNYALVIGYNEECEYGKGSAIFLHAKGEKHYTAGCVAVSRANVKRIVKAATEKTRICIYKE